VALNPSFPQEEIDIALENSLTGLRFSLAQPGTLASRAFDRLIWGDHPYGHVTTEGTLTNLTREDVVNYYNEQFDPDSALLIVAGDIMTEEALALAEATFGGLDSDGIRATPELPEPATPPALNLYVVDRPGSTQVDFLIGNLAINGSHPDRYKLAVMNDILGGGFSSRLFGNVREDKGFAYSIGSAVSTRVNNGVFIVRTAVRTEDAAAALREIIGEVERLQTETVTAEELQRTKDSLIGSMAVGLETYQSFVNQVASYKLNGLPIDTLSAFPDNIAAVAQADVMSVAQTYLLSEHFVVVAVGEASAIVEQLEAVAPVTLLEAE
jgi:zinc protease